MTYDLNIVEEELTPKAGSSQNKILEEEFLK